MTIFWNEKIVKKDQHTIISQSWKKTENWKLRTQTKHSTLNHLELIRLSLALPKVDICTRNSQFWNCQFSSESVNVLKEGWSDLLRKFDQEGAREQFCKKQFWTTGVSY